MFKLFFISTASGVQKDRILEAVIEVVLVAEVEVDTGVLPGDQLIEVRVCHLLALYVHLSFKKINTVCRCTRTCIQLKKSESF